MKLAEESDLLGARRRAREHALKMLYQADVGGLSEEDTLAAYWEREAEKDNETRQFAEKLVHGVLTDVSKLDAEITASSHNWPLARMAAVDRNVLRLALAELGTDPSTPDAVVIDEAVELAKEYGEQESGSFINGILEAVRRKRQLDGAAP